MSRLHLRCAGRSMAAATLFLGSAAAMPAWAQLPGADVTGRVFDTETGAGLPDVVVLVDGTGHGTVTNGAGLFRFRELPSGEHTFVFQHLAYGEIRHDLRVLPGDDLTLRINLSQAAIQLDELTVVGQSAEDRSERARGTQANIIHRDVIESAVSTGMQLDQLLSREIPGVVVRQPQTRGGLNVCVEFRSPRSIQDPLGCKAPTIFLDGVRMPHPGAFWSTFPLDEIERLEVVPSVEAGARYGTDSNYGVLLVETRTGSSMMGVESGLPTNRATYDWGLESDPYPWFEVFASSFVGNAIGLAAGAAVGSVCIEWDEGLANSHYFLESSCGGALTFGTTTMMFGLPVAGATIGANRAGRTDLSRGRWVPSAVAATLAVIPGTILVVAQPDESFSGSQLIGWAVLTLGVPAFTTIADRLFREFTESPLDPVTTMRR